MDAEQLKYFNLLSEKIINDIANETEINKFHSMLDSWNNSTQLKLLAKKPLSVED